MRTLTVFFTVAICLISISKAGKYSKSANSNSRIVDLDYEKIDQPFRMNKINLPWVKAKKKYSGSKLADVYAELAIQDKKEAKLKNARASDSDEEGTLEAEVHKSYSDIIRNFGLDESQSTHDDSKMSNEVPVLNSGRLQDTRFADVKLQSMWKRALKAGFSEKDLAMLKEEFEHQQTRIREIKFLNKARDTRTDFIDNSVHSNQFGSDEENMFEDEGKNELTPEEKIAAKKLRNREVREGYLNLEGLVSSLPRQAQDSDFKDSRVYMLWAMAKKTNWTKEELDSFKEELKHFEIRLEKQAFFQGQLEQSAQVLAGSEEVPEKHQKLEEKTQFLSRSVDKLYSSLKTKIEKNLKHVEL